MGGRDLFIWGLDLSIRPRYHGIGNSMRQIGRTYGGPPGSVSRVRVFMASLFRGLFARIIHVLGAVKDRGGTVLPCELRTGIVLAELGSVTISEIISYK